MQNRYVGDVGDFANNGLLRWLTGMRNDVPHYPIASNEDELRLSVLWWLNLPEDNRDGKHVRYLKNTSANRRRFGGCDDVLYAKLNKIISRNTRNIREIREGRILPWDTIFFSPYIPSTRILPTRLIGCARANWLTESVSLTADAELIFVNPDNGIAFGNISRTSPKHVNICELRELARSDKSLLVYHHLAQGRGPHKEQVRNAGNSLRKAFPYALVESFRYRAGTSRSYFLILQGKGSTIYISGAYKASEGPNGANQGAGCLFHLISMGVPW